MVRCDRIGELFKEHHPDEYKQFISKGHDIVRDELVAWTLLTAIGQRSDAIKQEAESLFGASWDDFYVHSQGQAKANDPSYCGSALYAIRASSPFFPPATTDWPAGADPQDQSKPARLFFVETTRFAFAGGTNFGKGEAARSVSSWGTSSSTRCWTTRTLPPLT